MKLLIDIGNSRIKWAWLEGETPGAGQAASYDRRDVSAWCDRYFAAQPQPAGVWVANVAGTQVAESLSRWCQSRWQTSPVFVQTERHAAGVINGYEDIREMGVDRWLAMVAARQCYARSLCIISCGTAVTVDVLTERGEHLGGLILPGPVLMSRLLEESTQGVRSDGGGPLRLELGRSTRDGVTAGSAHAIAGLIEHVFAEQQQDHPDMHGIITGGAAESILPLCRLPLELVHGLVLRGLAYYALRQS